MTFTRLPNIEGNELIALQNWLRENESLMSLSTSNYAQGRFQMEIRRRVSLGKVPKVEPAFDRVAKVSALVEEIGERLLPGFHQGLVLKYPKGTQILAHRDAPAYKLVSKVQGLAATVNAIGQCDFFVSSTQDPNNVARHFLGEGNCISFDNKQPHGIDRVTSERWCICFFYLKDEWLNAVSKSQQMELFRTSSKSAAVARDNISPKSVSSVVPKKPIVVNNHWEINWHIAVGVKVKTPTSEGIILLIGYQNPDFPNSGLSEITVQEVGGSLDYLYAHQCVPI